MNDFDLDIDLYDLPLTHLLGSRLQKVAASSLSMRRALRYVANVHVASPKNSIPRSQSAQLSTKALKQLLAQTLLNVLTFPMEGRRSTQALRIRRCNLQVNPHSGTYFAAKPSSMAGDSMMRSAGYRSSSLTC
jgi:hypothetical protein